MIKHNQDGAVSGVAISLVLTVILLLGAIGFAAWAFNSRQDYKNHTDIKVSAAVQAAKAQESATKDKQFAEAEKKPLKTYNGPGALGSLVISFPKTWSGYVDAGSQNSTTLNGYFSPGVVPSVTNKDSVFALRVQVVGQPYADVLRSFTSLQQDGKISISAYALPKLPKIVGVKVSGELADQKNGTIVVLPLRSQTLEIQTDGDQFVADFNNNILPNFSFSP